MTKEIVSEFIAARDGFDPDAPESVARWQKALDAAEGAGYARKPGAALADIALTIGGKVVVETVSAARSEPEKAPAPAEAPAPKKTPAPKE